MINKIAEGDLSPVLHVANRYRETLNDAFTVSDVFDACYREIEKDYANEYVFKNTIARKILIGRHSLKTSTMLSEFRIEKNKADCVIINGESTCYEIKTKYDKLDRLPEQISAYLKIFEKTYVVIDESHLEKVINICPKEVGIISLTKRKTLKENRPARNPELPINANIAIKSLRQQEYKEVVKNIYGEVPEASNTEIFSKCMYLLETADPERLRTEYFKTLKKHRKTSNLVLKLPECLTIAAISYKLSKKSQENLVKNMDFSFRKDSLCTSQYFAASNLS